MNSHQDPIVAEVRHIRAELQEKYGGWEGYLKHQKDDRPRLEAEGWHFVTQEEIEKLVKPRSR
jgi:hypothetical protein